MLAAGQGWCLLGRVRVLAFRCRGFRNLAAAGHTWAEGRHAFVGANGQGKTNLLEGIGLVSALRSFRTIEGRSLPAWGQSGYALAWTVDHERRGRTEIQLTVERGKRVLEVDGERLNRFGDYVGEFPTTVFTAQDLQLLRGSPAVRRRLLDFVLASVDGDYLDDLRRYHRGLEGRNRLLKTGAHDRELAAFEQALADSAARLVVARRAGIAAWADDLATAYAAFAPASEQPSLDYRPDTDADAASAWLERWARGRVRDRAAGVTQQGPHRDDFSLRLGGRDAREFASEGQQRSLVLALRLAQAAFLHHKTGIRPVILADDILGELDPERRRAFWNALDPQAQLFATGTTVPASPNPQAWTLWDVSAGQLTARS